MTYLSGRTANFLANPQVRSPSGSVGRQMAVPRLRSPRRCAKRR
jgi:hypothetical protein